MTALCGARVSVNVVRCNAPASRASDPDVPLCERCIRMRDDVVHHWGHKAHARVYIPAHLKIDEPAIPTAPAKQMKRAMANGFARHEPAYTPAELAIARSAA